MEGNVLLTLLGLCVGLVASNQDTALKEFDFTKFSGIWFEITVASKKDVYSSPHEVEKMGSMLVEVEGDFLTLTLAYSNEGHCVLEKVVASQGDLPGKFKVITEVGNKDVVIVDTDYKTYAIMDIAFPVPRTLQKLMKLYTRKLRNNEEAQNKFQEEALERGYSASDIQQFQHDLTCVKILAVGDVLNS